MAVRFRLVTLNEAADRGTAGIVQSTKDNPNALPQLSGSMVHVALVSETAKISFGDLRRAAAALQKQIARDVRPIWNLNATVDAFESIKDTPDGYWPLIIKDDIGVPGTKGIHMDRDGKPFAMVTYSSNMEWSLTASHELVDMLVDPLSNRMVPGPSPNPADGGKKVEILLEVATPVESADSAYMLEHFPI
jgi:hypothetical protein